MPLETGVWNISGNSVNKISFKAITDKKDLKMFLKAILQFWVKTIWS